MKPLVFIGLKTKCKFNRAWIGKCKLDADESGYCTKHKDRKCIICGVQADRQCSNTLSGLVCGSPLCKEHQNSCQRCNPSR